MPPLDLLRSRRPFAFRDSLRLFPSAFLHAAEAVWIPSGAPLLLPPGELPASQDCFSFRLQSSCAPFPRVFLSRCPLPFRCSRAHADRFRCPGIQTRRSAVFLAARVCDDLRQVRRRILPIEKDRERLPQTAMRITSDRPQRGSRRAMRGSCSFSAVSGERGSRRRQSAAASRAQTRTGTNLCREEPHTFAEGAAGAALDIFFGCFAVRPLQRKDRRGGQSQVLQVQTRAREDLQRGLPGDLPGGLPGDLRHHPGADGD